MSAQSSFHAGPRARLLVVDIACDQHNDQRSNRRHSVSSQCILHLHFTYFSNKMNKTLESESCSIRRFALGLYPKTYISQRFSRGHTHKTPLLLTPTSRNFQPNHSHTSRIPTYLMQSKNIHSFIHSFKHNLPSPTLYQAGASLS